MENYLRFCWLAGVVKNLRNLEYEILKLPNLSKFSNLSTKKANGQKYKRRDVLAFYLFAYLLNRPQYSLVDRVDKVVEGVVLEVGVARDIGAELCLHNVA